MAKRRPNTFSQLTPHDAVGGTGLDPVSRGDPGPISQDCYPSAQEMPPALIDMFFRIIPA